MAGAFAEVHGEDGVLETRADADASAALHGTPLLLAHATPDAGVLTAVERPLEALVDHGTATADRLGLLDLENGRAGRPDGEEQLRVLVAADGTVTPVH